MSTVVSTPSLALIAHIRRLSAAGTVLYIRIANPDVSRLGLGHGQAIEVDLGRVRIAGIVKTSGGSPWLAPAPGRSNLAITAALREAGFEHGMDVPATVRSSGSASGSSRAMDTAPARLVSRIAAQLQGGDILSSPWCKFGFMNRKS